MPSKIEYLEWEPPTRGESWEDMAPYVVWKSKCGGYRVVRIDGVAPRFQSIAKVDYPGAKETTIQNDMKLLSVALISVEKYHKKHTGVDEVVTRNYKQIMKEAEECGLDTKPVSRWIDTAAIKRLKTMRESKKAEVFEIDEATARKFLASVGYGKARKEFNRTQLKEKLNRLDAVEHTLKDPRKQENKNLLEDCLQALAKGQTIMLKSKKAEFVSKFDEDPEKIGRMYDAGAFGENPGQANEVETKAENVTVDEQHTYEEAVYPDGESSPLYKYDTKPLLFNETKSLPKKLGCLDAAAKVLVESGKSMSCKDMIKAMADKGYWTSTAKTPNITLNSAINTEIKVGYKKGPSRFIRLGFGLYELSLAYLSQRI